MYSYHYTDLFWPRGFQEVEAPGFLDKRYMKEVRFSDLSTVRLYPKEILVRS